MLIGFEFYPITNAFFYLFDNINIHVNCKSLTIHINELLKKKY